MTTTFTKYISAVSIALFLSSCIRDFSPGEDSSVANSSEPLAIYGKKRQPSNNSIYGDLLVNFSIKKNSNEDESYNISITNEYTKEEITYKTADTITSVPLSLLLEECSSMTFEVSSINNQGQVTNTVKGSKEDICNYSSLDIEVSFDELTTISSSLTPSRSTSAVSTVQKFLVDNNISHLYRLDSHLNYTTISRKKSIYVEDQINVSSGVVTQTGDNDFNDFSYNYSTIFSKTPYWSLMHSDLREILFPIHFGRVDAAYSSKIGFFIYYRENADRSTETPDDLTKVRQASFSTTLKRDGLVTTNISLKSDFPSFMRDYSGYKENDFIIKVELDGYKDFCFNNRSNISQTNSELYFDCQTPIVWRLSFENTSYIIDRFRMVKIIPFVYIKNTGVLVFSEGVIKDGVFYAQESLPYNTLLEFKESDTPLDIKVTGKSLDTRYPGYRAWRNSGGEKSKDWYQFPQ